MTFIDSFLGAQTPKTRMNKGFLNGGGGGLRCSLKTAQKLHSARLNECYDIHKNDISLGKFAYFDTC